MIDTSKTFKSPLFSMHYLISRLSISIRLMMAFLLGLVAGLIMQSEIFSILYVLLFFMTVAVALTIKLSARFIKLATFASFMSGSLLVGLYPYSSLGPKIYILIMMLVMIWVFVMGCAFYALSNPEKYFNYFYNIILWVLVFTVSWLAKASIIISFAITMTVIVKIFQLLLTEDWTVKRAKAYVFSVLLPSILGVSFAALSSYDSLEANLDNDYSEVIEQSLINTDDFKDKNEGMVIS
ncbi:hypothetical protein [Psychrobacter sp. DAB_AL43B]|uniref:hypothetical protein n=1 Tax=Psychrobacter sp. DAB_AL43B TaxID=1028416 RepID=UPI0011AB5A56|nr:hypothetical protein [Psychrobacter sp. DAB_AL43B]